MQQAEIEPQTCGVCTGTLRRVRHVPLKSFEGQRIFECADCGQLIMVRHNSRAPRARRRRTGQGC